MMVIPKQHIDYVFDLEEPLYSELFQITKDLSEPLKRAMKAKRIGVAIEGFSVSHVHVHLVPINNVNQLNPARAKRATSGLNWRKKLPTARAS